MAERVLLTCVVCFLASWVAYGAEGEMWDTKDTAWHYVIATVGVSSLVVAFGDMLYIIWR